MYGAHRVAYTLKYGAISPGLIVCHSCDVPTCCNPAHLFSGTYADNNADASAKGRLACGDRSGARLHPERLARGDANGSRLHPERLRRGSMAARSRLSEEQVRSIRERHAAGGVSMRGLAREYGVSHPAVAAILHGRSWRHTLQETAR
jgi:hypothetical protein